MNLSRIKRALDLVVRLPWHVRTLRGQAQHQQAWLQDQQAQLHDQQAQLQALRAEVQALQTQWPPLQHAQQALLARHEILERDHQASVSWLQAHYPELVAAIGRKIEAEQLRAHSEKLYAALLRELTPAPGVAEPSGLPRPASTPVVPNAAAPAVAPVAPAAAPAMEDGLYLALERRFRGSLDELKQRQLPYLSYLAGRVDAARPLLDIGCGRGEWLALLRTHGLPAQGVDLNPINALCGRQDGLDVTAADAVAYLAASSAGQFGAITAFQLVEHLGFDTLLRLLRQAYQALAPGGLLILETPNPENLLVASHSFWLDPTHIKPLPPELLEFLLQECGFVDLTTLRLNPHERYVPPPSGPANSSGTPRPLGGPDELAQRLYGPRDYAILAYRPLV